VLDLVLPQKPKTSQDVFQTAPAIRVRAVFVVYLGGTVDADSNEHPPPLQETTPGIIEQRPVGLKHIDDLPARPGKGLLVTHRLPKELQAGQHGLSSLP